MPIWAARNKLEGCKFNKPDLMQSNLGLGVQMPHCTSPLGYITDLFYTVSHGLKLNKCTVKEFRTILVCY